MCKIIDTEEIVLQMKVEQWEVKRTTASKPKPASNVDNGINRKRIEVIF